MEKGTRNREKQQWKKKERKEGRKEGRKKGKKQMESKRKNYFVFITFASSLIHVEARLIKNVRFFAFG